MRGDHLVYWIRFYTLACDLSFTAGVECCGLLATGIFGISVVEGSIC